MTADLMLSCPLPEIWSWANMMEFKLQPDFNYYMYKLRDYLMCNIKINLLIIKIDI